MTSERVELLCAMLKALESLRVIAIRYRRVITNSTWALENNFARDYATEKFFVRINDGFDPIELGQASYSRIAPPTYSSMFLTIALRKRLSMSFTDWTRTLLNIVPTFGGNTTTMS
jgi:Glycosyltransferase family 10 (fucosyltransferase) C-term